MIKVFPYIKNTALLSLFVVSLSCVSASASSHDTHNPEKAKSPLIQKISNNKCLSLSEEDKKAIEKATQKPLLKKDLCFSSAKQASAQKEELFLSLAYTPVIDRIVKKFKTNPQTTAAIVRASHREAKKHDLDPLLVLSVIATESSFNPKAKNPSGAMGLMQAIPKWHYDKINKMGISRADLLNVNENIMLGTSILKEYLTLSNGNTKRALQRYNGASKDRSFRYSNKVLNQYRYLSNSPTTSALP